MAASGAFAGVVSQREAAAQDKVTRATRGTPSPKIKDVSVIATAPAGLRLAVVKIVTDQPGLYGYGCATYTQRADLVVEAIVYKPVRIATRMGIAGAVMHAVSPKLTQIILNTAFRMFPDSSAAQTKKGEVPKEVEMTPEAMAFAQITQGIHW